ncbi:unnamed protein product, partial [Tuber aestivum]
YRIIPYSRNRKFTGREHLIHSVERHCKRDGHNRIALHGLGGAGKTQIALEYVYRRAREGDCDIFWVQGSGASKFREDFRAIGKHVRNPLASAETEEEGSLLSIKRWFEGRDNRDWILVIDNADNEEDFVSNNSPIAKFVPHGLRGTVIFTTRSHQVAFRQECERIGVETMAKDEAKKLFFKHFGNWGSLRDGEEEVVRRTNLLSQQFSDIRRESDVTESILSTYFITFDRITRQMPTAGHLLRLIAFVDRQNIPEQLLRDSGVEGMDDPVEFRRAVGKLLGFSLITATKHEGETLYELHRLIQLSVQAYSPPEELQRWSYNALRIVSRMFPKYEHGLRDICKSYIPHALAVTK